MVSKKTLWRAAEDDYIPDAAAFSAERAVAEAYMHNRGFGGPLLYRAIVRYDPMVVLNLYDLEDPLGEVASMTGLRRPGALGVEEWIPMDPEVQTRLHDLGFDWVVVRDSFPDGAETWLWIGDFEHEPRLRRVN